MEHLAGRCVERVAGQPGGRPKSLFKEQSGKGSQGGWGWEAVAPGYPRSRDHYAVAPCCYLLGAGLTYTLGGLRHGWLHLGWPRGLPRGRGPGVHSGRGPGKGRGKEKKKMTSSWRPRSQPLPAQPLCACLAQLANPLLQRLIILSGVSSRPGAPTAPQHQAEPSTKAS